MCKYNTSNIKSKEVETKKKKQPEVLSILSIFGINGKVAKALSPKSSKIAAKVLMVGDAEPVWSWNLAHQRI